MDIALAIILKSKMFSNREEKSKLRSRRRKSPCVPMEIYKKGKFFESNFEAMSQKFNLSICQLKKKSTGKGIVEPSEQMDLDEAISIHFHEEILVNILSRLPVRYLLQFKCVSKFWRTLISDPYFKIKHLNHAKNDPNSQKLLISQWFPKDGVISTYCCPLSSDQLVNDVQKLDCPSISIPWRCAIHCSSDGLAIIGVFDGVSSILLLWNPSTRESAVLPSLEFPRGGLRRLGLGYDSASGDYKILQICDDTNDPKLPSEILELKTGSWRKIGKHPRCFRNVVSGMHSLAFVHEAFHWIGISNNYSVVSFSISSVRRDTLARVNIIHGQNLYWRFSIGRNALCSLYFLLSEDRDF